MISTDALLAACPVIPVVVLKDAAQAVPLARAMVAGGIPVLEITLRTEAALDSIRAVRAEVPDAITGAGTVRTVADLDASLAAGAQFIVSPGATDELLKAARDRGVTLLPGVATVSEAMRAADHGFTMQKFFPAEANGGAPVLKAWAGPLPDLRFCPTGGVNAGNAANYLALKNVPVVGGSWMLSTAKIEEGDFAGVTADCQAAVDAVTATASC